MKDVLEVCYLTSLLSLFVARLFFTKLEHRLWTAYGYFGLAALLVILDCTRSNS